MLKTKAGNSDLRWDRDIPIVIATLPATPSQRRAAVGAMLFLFFLALAVAPFAQIQLERIDAFVPVLQTVLSIADFLTASILFAQYPLQPQRSLLAIGSAYLFSGSFAFLQTLTFPGGYAPAGVMGDGFNSPAWFFVLWHTTFPLAILVYALLKDRHESEAVSQGSPGLAIAATLISVFSIVAVASWTVTAGVSHLPSFYTGSITQRTRLGDKTDIALLLLGATVVMVLFARRRTMLDLWLIVTLMASMPSFLVAAAASSVRFSLGWYAARGFALIASCMLLSVLLTELMVLYSRLASALTLQRRERTNRLMSVDAATAAIAHEIRQPLGTIALNANTALNQVRAEPPDMDDVDAMLEEIEAASHRAGAIITSVRQLFGSRPEQRKKLRLGGVAEHALSLMQHELRVNEVRIRADFPPDLPEVFADATQLQQVILNLVKNAVDAMQSVPADARFLQVATQLDGPFAVRLTVQDTGIGISEESEARIFDPFYSTKPSGMGLGLAICRTIVEDHGGELRLSASSAHGSTFDIILAVHQPRELGVPTNAGR
jgi:signal transduction histidine kinase